MRRSRPLPTETTAAISFVVVASLVAMAVLVRHVEEQHAVETAARSSVSPAPVDDEQPPADVTTTTTTSPASAAPTTTASPSAAPTTSTTSTTSTVQPSATKSPAPPTSTVEADPECAGLVSDTYWTRTGERSVLVVAAGGTARYAEVVTNESDEPCVLATNRCGTTAELRTASGERTDAPSLACSDQYTEAVLEPGDQRSEQLTVAFPVPPGDYVAHIRRYDGTAVDLPVRLDDRLPACPSETLVLQVNGGEQGRDASDIRGSGMDIDLVLTGAPESCTVRTVESRLRLDSTDDQIDLVDDTHRWLADPGEIDIHTHMVAPPAEVPPGRYEGLVTIVLQSGDQVAAPLELIVR